jgi:hypothetical protein
MIETEAHKKLALQALSQMRGDDLFRAQMAFKNMTPKEMNMQHGQSGKTRAEILAEYEAHDFKVAAAMRWLEGISA